ncbi:GNAT family N-acetyltransferase [Salipaludibacillus sp. LMS25]|jgi:phosphinothricin acetyltransferase|uniref:GNAT family N-acetyltransferase n=1 Tax=Salipaludibacillus sp. LMS25 TaxID=2924031 RepID=UPI0020D12B9A|nr:GNAT family N-acetyltransferase [Salipaludibacillus sp. LMS25]UTR15456.1 GNAT family N-acetyltransferase [Salipaludibacillus sp. LMS25]
MRRDIRAMTVEHWPQVKTIYEEGIASKIATFETKAPTWKEWDSSHLSRCRLVMTASDVVVGWAALTFVSSRCVYAGVAEVSIYVKGSERGQGIGSVLLNELIKESEKEHIWTLQSGIFPENKGSLQLHYNNGFRLVGRRERIAKLDGNWKDVLLLERRSLITGLS